MKRCLTIAFAMLAATCLAQWGGSMWVPRRSAPVATTTTTTIPEYPDPPQLSNVVLLLRFSEDFTGSGVANDSSPSGLNDFINVGAGWTNAYGGAALLDGSNWLRNTSSSLMDGENEMSLMMWVRPGKFNDFDGLMLAQGTTNPFTSCGMRLTGLGQGVRNDGVVTVIDGTYAYVDDDDVMSVNVWTCLGMTWQYGVIGSGVPKVFCNGVKRTSNDSAFRSDPMTVINYWYLGSDLSDFSQSFSGMVKHVIMWNKALTTNEMMQAFTSTTNGLYGFD